MSTSVCRTLIAFLSGGDVLLEVCVKFVEVDYIVACSELGEIAFGVNVEVRVVTFVRVERRDTCGFARGIVVSELCEGKKLGPVILLVTTVMSKVLFERLIDTLCLTIRLWVVSRCEVETHVERLTQRAKETRYELGTAIRCYVRGNAVLREYMLYEQ